MHNLKILLASKSPRRLELLKALDFEVEQILFDFEESYPSGISPEKIPEYLSIQKMEKAITYRTDQEIVLTADTIVLHQHRILHKPRNAEEARAHIRALSGTMHEVVSGVCLWLDERIQFSVTTRVWMNPVTERDINYYVDRYQPTDKAGAYGIQEWIGWSYIRKIEGSYSNVMGLPTAEVYAYLSTYFNRE